MEHAWGKENDRGSEDLNLHCSLPQVQKRLEAPCRGSEGATLQPMVAMPLPEIHELSPGTCPPCVRSIMCEPLPKAADTCDGARLGALPMSAVLKDFLSAMKSSTACEKRRGITWACSHGTEAAAPRPHTPHLIGALDFHAPDGELGPGGRPFDEGAWLVPRSHRVVLHRDFHVILM